VASILSLALLGGSVGSMPASAEAKAETFLPCALSAATAAWVYMAHPPECILYRGARNREDEVQLERIGWHHWGSKRATGAGRWLTSYEFPHEESAPVRLVAYRRVGYPGCLISGSGYTRLRVETTDSALPPEVVFKLARPPACKHPGKPAQEIGDQAR
jgi:hypothetical protein